MKNILSTIVLSLTQSSENPEKTSATLTGILISVSTYLASVVGPHVPVIADFYASPLGMQANAICTSLGMVAGGILFLFGVIRKGTNKVEAKIIG